MWAMRWGSSTGQQDGLALLHRPVEEPHRIAHIGADQLPVLQKLVVQRLHVQGGLVVQVLEQDVLHLYGAAQPLPETVLVKQVAHLDARFGVLVRIEGGNTALGGAEGFAAQTLLLIPVLEDVVGHQQLGPLGHDEVGGGHPLAGDLLQLRRQFGRVQRHPVADDVGDVRVENAGRQDVQGETPIVVDDGVARIGPALEAHHHVRRLGQQIGDLALALVAPVGPYDRFYHKNTSAPGIRSQFPWSALSGAHCGPMAQ